MIRIREWRIAETVRGLVCRRIGTRQHALGQALIARALLIVLACCDHAGRQCAAECAKSA